MTYYPPSYGQTNYGMAQYQSQQMQPAYQMPQQPVQPAQQPMPQPVNLKGWPVSSMEEAQNARIELDGSIFVFPDLQNGKIYTKQISMADFSPIFRIYQLSETPALAKNQGIDLSGYVPRADFEQLWSAHNQLAQICQRLQEVVQQLAENTTSTPTTKRTAKEAAEK